MKMFWTLQEQETEVDILYVSHIEDVNTPLLKIQSPVEY